MAFRRSVKRILRFPFEHLNMSGSRNFFIFLLPIMTSMTVILIVLPGPFNVVFGCSSLCRSSHSGLSTRPWRGCRNLEDCSNSADRSDVRGQVDFVYIATMHAELRQARFQINKIDMSLQGAWMDPVLQLAKAMCWVIADMNCQPSSSYPFQGLIPLNR
ncbi:hypothetical protein IWQ54_006505 [Labrenzia sp. EL_195]|nr:hypothetical protein [Labrenzia sp. EL_195]